MREADRILVVSSPMQQLFARHYPEIDPAKFTLITNGYDPQDFQEAERVELLPDRFHLVYTGSLYGIQRERFLNAIFVYGLSAPMARKLRRWLTRWRFTTWLSWCATSPTVR